MKCKDTKPDWKVLVKFDCLTGYLNKYVNYCMLDIDKFEVACQAAIRAGEAIMKVYAGTFEVEYKYDQSPLTIADKQSHTIIQEELQKFGIPILSEEGASIHYNERKIWNEYWLVDPLDGTKEFVKRNGDFTVNIAFIKSNHPVAGIIYAPVKEILYFAFPGIGAFRCSGRKELLEYLTLDSLINNSEKLPSDQTSEFVIVASKSHQNYDTEAFISDVTKQKGNVQYLQVGSSLKFCAMAEGSADLYPRLGPTMEWDTAAGHAIAELAGCQVRKWGSESSLEYNKEDLLNPWFLVSR